MREPCGIRQAVIELDAARVQQLVREFLEEGVDPRTVLEAGLIAGMKDVGELFARKEYFVPEVLVASEAFYAGFDLVRPSLAAELAPRRAKIVIGVVEGDIHDIGKNIVKVMLEASEYEVVDLGRDVSVERFIDAVVGQRPQVLALSALMSTTMMRMGEVIQALEHQGVRGGIRVIVGGAPVGEEFARRIGADGYGGDAAHAVRLVERLAEAKDGPRTSGRSPDEPPPSLGTSR
jgi:dimethylamine corrinoid protein